MTVLASVRALDVYELLSSVAGPVVHDIVTGGRESYAKTHQSRYIRYASPATISINFLHTVNKLGVKGNSTQFNSGNLHTSLQGTFIKSRVMMMFVACFTIWMFPPLECLEYSMETFVDFELLYHQHFPKHMFKQ